MFRVSLGCLFLCVLHASSRADIVINVGDRVLLPNQSGQTIEILVTGGDQVQGLNFNIQIVGDLPAPVFEDVDILTGAIFASNNSGANHVGDLPQLQAWSTTTQSGTVSAEGRLASVVVDTTGLLSGTWDLNMLDTANGPTDFASDTLALSITDGSITISAVPEPGNLARFSMLLLAAVIAVHGAFAQPSSIMDPLLAYHRYSPEIDRPAGWHWR